MHTLGLAGMCSDDFVDKRVKLAKLVAKLARKRAKLAKLINIRTASLDLFKFHKFRKFRTFTCKFRIKFRTSYTSSARSSVKQLMSTCWRTVDKRPSKEQSLCHVGLVKFAVRSCLLVSQCSLAYSFVLPHARVVKLGVANLPCMDCSCFRPSRSRGITSESSVWCRLVGLVVSISFDWCAPRARCDGVGDLYPSTGLLSVHGVAVSAAMSCYRWDR